MYHYIESAVLNSDASAVAIQTMPVGVMAVSVNAFSYFAVSGLEASWKKYKQVLGTRVYVYIQNVQRPDKIDIETKIRFRSRSCLNKFRSAKRDMRHHTVFEFFSETGYRKHK